MDRVLALGRGLIMKHPTIADQMAGVPALAASDVRENLVGFGRRHDDRLHGG